MTAQTPMTPERLADARAALDEDMSQWGGEYGLELIEEVKRLQPFESIVPWQYGDTTGGRTRADMITRAARAMYENGAAAASWGELTEPARAYWREDARAALDAALGTQEEPA
ncbi:hypothetical protein ACUW97_000820 [Kocuria rhizophila]